MTFRFHRRLPPMLAALVVALACGSLVGEAAAQDKSGEAAVPAEAGEGVHQSEVDIFYVRDEDGDLVRFTEAISYEDLIRIYRILERGGGGGDLPPLVIDAIRIAGEVKEHHAELEFAFDIRLLGETGWRQANLRLSRAVLLDKAAFAGEGKYVFTVDPKDRSKIINIWGERDSLHTISFRAAVPLAAVSQRSQLTIALPSAASSRLELTVPGEDIEPEPVAAANLRPLERESGRTKLTVFGAAGDFDLAWRTPSAEAAPSRRVLNVTSRVETHLLPDSATSEAHLRVESLSGSFDGFTVRLPPDMEIVAGASIGGEVRPRSDPDQGRQVLDVSFEPTQAVDLRLIARSDGRNGRNAAPWRLGGFEVTEAIRQTGTVDVYLDGDLTAEWSSGPGVERREIDEEARRAGVAARFAIFRQPHDISVRIAPRRKRVSVDATYVARVEREGIALDARWDYRLRGSTDAIELDLAGWEPEAGRLESLGAVVEKEDGPGSTVRVLVPSTALVEAEDGTQELFLKLYRPLAPDAGEVRFPLPRPLATSFAGTLLLVSPAQNIQLSPRPEEIEGLVAETGSVAIAPLDPQQIYFAFRGRGDGETAIFAADVQILPQSIFVSTTTSMDVGPERTSVRQTMHYRVDHEPARSLLLRASRDIVEAGELSLLMGGAPLTWSRIDQPSDRSERPSFVELRVDLPQPTLGDFEIVLEFRLPTPEVKAGASVDWSPSLVAPAATASARFGGQQVEIEASPEFSLESRPGFWRGSAADAAADSTTLQLTAAGTASEIPLRLSRVQEVTSPACRLHRAWIQTWLDRDGRRDRAVFQITPLQDRLRINLPAGVLAGEVEVAVDGRRQEAFFDSSKKLLVQLADDSEAASPADERPFTVVEIWYVFPPSSSRADMWGGRTITFPHLAETDRPSRFYWQLVLGGNEHLAEPPAAMSAEYDWRVEEVFAGLGYWRRSPHVDQAWLEQWSGASAQSAPPASAHAYPFSSWDEPQSVRVHSFDRRALVLGGSVLVLVCGFLLFFFQRLRHPLSLLAVGAAVITAAFFFPEAALQIAQSAALGLVVVLAALCLNWILARSRRPRPVLRGGLAPAAGRRSDTASFRGEGDHQPHAAGGSSFTVRGSDSAA